MDITDISLVGLAVFIVTAIVQAITTSYLKKGYLPEKGKLRALTEDYPRIKQQLIDNTKAVEGIRDDLANKSWARQQVWAEKKAAYDQVWGNMLDMKEYVSERLAVDGYYYEIYLDHCGYGGLCEGGLSEEDIKSYYEQAEKEINLEKEKFNKKYNTEQYVAEQEQKKKQYIENLNKSLKNIELQTMYLSQDISDFSDFLKDLVNNQFKDNSYTWEISEEEGITEKEWYEHILSEYEKLLNALDKQMVDVKNLARRELYLET